MKFYKLTIPKKPICQGMAADSRLDSIYGYLSTYTGQPGYDFACDCVDNSSDYYQFIGEYVFYLFNEIKTDSNKCYALCIEDDDNIVDLLYPTDDNKLQWDNSWHNL